MKGESLETFPPRAETRKWCSPSLEVVSYKWDKKKISVEKHRTVFLEVWPLTSSVTLSVQTTRPPGRPPESKTRGRKGKCVWTSPQGARTCADVWEAGLRDLGAHPGLLSGQGLRPHPLCVLASSTLQMSHVLRTALCGRRPRWSEMPAEPAFPG